MMEDLSFHILDIVENAIAAGAKRVIIAVNENEKRDILTFRVTDDGCGMSAEDMGKAFNPFFTTKRKKTGLGLALLAQTAETCGGKVTLESAPHKGTKVAARFRFGHIDRPPLTKMTETVMMLVFGHSEIDFRYRHRRNGRDFAFSSQNFMESRGSGGPELIREVRKELRAGLKRIGAGAP